MKLAVPVTSLTGEKKDVSFLSILIKNIEKNEVDAFEKIVLETISANKGFVGKGEENEVLALFMDALDAIKAALDIKEKTGPINVIMGIGIHTNATVVNESDVLKYATIGTPILAVRMLAQKSKNNVMISKETKAKVGAAVKVEDNEGGFIVKGISRREDFRKDVERIVKDIKSQGKGFDVVR